MMSNTSQKSTDLTAKPLTTISGHEEYIWRIAYLPGGERVVTCSGDKTIRIWNVEKGEQEGTSMVHENALESLAVTRDGKRILGGGEDKKIRVWDVETHEQVEEWASHTSDIDCIALSPDDQLAANGTADGKIVIREMTESGGIKHSIDAGRSVESLDFSPNGEKLACGVTIGTDRARIIQIYDVESGQPVLGPIKAHEAWVNCVLWSHDGSQLFSASNDHTIRCWDPETGESIGEPWTGHTDTVCSLSLSPDGTKVASGSFDNTVRFWDSRSGDPIDQPLQHERAVFAVTFSPSGEFVASGGYDGKLSIWRVPWWDDSQKQTHRSLLDLPAVPLPKDQHRGEFDFFDLPTRRRPIISSSLPPVPANSTTVPLTARVQRFWHGLTTRRSPLPPPQQTIELRPIQGRRFWKSAVRIPVTEVAAGRLSDRVKVGKSVPKKKKKKKDEKSRKPQKPQTDAGSSGTKAGPSTSHAAQSTSDAGPSNSQAGPSNAASAGRSSSFAQSNTGSDDSWDDMYCCDKCVDYGCFGPRENRERFRPWKKKSRATMEAEKQAKAKKRKHHRKHRKTKAADPPSVVHPPHHLDPHNDSIQTVSLASPAAQEAERQRIALYLKEHNEQLLRQLDDAVAAKEKAEAERDALEKKNVEPFLHRSDESHGLREPQRPTGSPSAGAGPSSTQGNSDSKRTAGPSADEAGPSASSNVPGQESRSTSTRFHAHSLKDQERTKKGKGREIDLGHPTHQAVNSRTAVHALHHDDPQRDDIKAGSSTSPAADEVDYHRVSMLLQDQVEHLRRQLDDSRRMAEAEMYLLENAIKELRSRGHDSHDRQGPHLSPGSSTAEAGPSGFKSTVVAPSSQAQPVSSNDPSRPHPSSPVQSVSDSID